jgi:hypothetical protein
MPYSEELDNRILKLTSDWGIVRKKMFGGTCYLVNGNMMFGVYKDYLILRLNEEEASEMLKLKYAKPFDIIGKPMKGWIMIEKGGFGGSKLSEYLKKSKKIVENLPKK